MHKGTDAAWLESSSLTENASKVTWKSHKYNLHFTIHHLYIAAHWHSLTEYLTVRSYICCMQSIDCRHLVHSFLLWFCVFEFNLVTQSETSRTDIQTPSQYIFKYVRLPWKVFSVFDVDTGQTGEFKNTDNVPECLQTDAIWTTKC